MAGMFHIELSRSRYSPRRAHGNGREAGTGNLRRYVLSGLAGEEALGEGSDEGDFDEQADDGLSCRKPR